MGYARTEKSLYFTPSDAVICEDPRTVGRITPPHDYSVYTKRMQLTLLEPIHPESRFRFKMDLKAGAVGDHCYGKIYKNGVAVGTEYGDNTGAFQTFTEDIDVGDWKANDTVELWIRISGSVNWTCRKLQLCGVGSEWLNNRWNE